MKLKDCKLHWLSTIFVSLAGILVFFVAMSCTLKEPDQKVLEAYALRVGGHADSAGVLLDELLKAHPDMAMAWYEQARTTLHIGMSNPREIKESLENAMDYIGRAVEKEPENALYHSYKGGIETLRFYMAMQMGDENAKEHLIRIEETYKKVFQLDPTYYENKITLVEFFGGLPEEMGGDKVKAEQYALELENADLVSGAKAREIMMPDDADYVAFWKDILGKVPEDADAHQALGRVYLFMGNFDEAQGYYQKAIDLDRSKNDLYIDLGRYQLMQAMQNPAGLDSLAPLIREQFDKYLNSSPEPLNPMKAWTYSKLAMISNRTGDAKGAEELMKKANELDPFHSPAFGKPGMGDFCPPDEVVHEQGYYLSPF